MPIVNILTENPGLDALVANGPSITIIEQLIQAQVFSRGRTVVCAVGSVINDQGASNVPTLLEARAQDLVGTYGGWAPWLGDGLAAGEAGHTSGYEGNLYARLKGGDVPVLILSTPDMALKDLSITNAAAVDQLITLTRAVATNGNVTIPAGTRIKPAVGTFVVATLEDVTYGLTETGDKAVRVRAASDAGVSPVAMNTLDTFVSNGLTTAPGDANITIDTASASASPPDAVDNAEAIERYKHAIDRLLNNVVGRSATVVVTDRDEPDIADHMASHCVDAAQRGYTRICVVSPPKGTSSTDARGTGVDGVGRGGLDRTRVVYAHPGVERRFTDDADNLGETRLATLPGAMLATCRIAASQPWQNPGEAGGNIFSNYGVVGDEDLGGAPDLITHFQSGILQLDSVVDESGVSFEYFDGIMALIPSGSVKPQTIDDRRMTDYLERGFVRAVRPWHKRLASQRNRNFTAAAIEAFLARELSAQDPDNAHIAAFSPIEPVWNGALQVASFPVEVQLLGSQRVILIPFTVGTGVITSGS